MLSYYGINLCASEGFQLLKKQRGHVTGAVKHFVNTLYHIKRTSVLTYS